tara:strand:- start:46465 stop:46776 length:312 start_codon:yes stop_codon:yes gene_type:complete
MYILFITSSIVGPKIIENYYGYEKGKITDSYMEDFEKTKIPKRKLISSVVLYNIIFSVFMGYIVYKKMYDGIESFSKTIFIFSIITLVLFFLSFLISRLSYKF